ncbi:hypothetical protein [Streptomyces griseus]|uniref:hypothetical protein n=1 Tax=Streptomyces griseus TaxID=1911 RepID=UPI0036F7406C
MVTQAFLAVLPQGSDDGEPGGDPGSSGGSGPDDGSGPGGESGPDDGSGPGGESGPGDGSDGGAGAAIEAARRRRRELIGPWMHTFDPRLRGVLADAVAGSPAAWFERKLGLFLDGVAGRRR